MSASDTAYEHVKQAIFSGELATSTLITEGEVAEQLSISRTPVREAFLRLQAEGMIELYPKKGALVIPATAQETREVFEARALIEQWAANQVWARRADAVPGLRAQLDAMDAARRAGDAAAFSAADRAFHAVIVDLAGNSVIARQYAHLRDRQVVIVAANIRSGASRMAASCAQHRELLRLLETGTKAAFVAACGEHVSYAGNLAIAR